MQIISLLCLAGAIVFGFVRKTNVGIVSLGLSLALGKLPAEEDRTMEIANHNLVGA